MCLDFVFSLFAALFNDDVCELHLINRKSTFFLGCFPFHPILEVKKQLYSSGRLGSQKRLKAAVSATLIPVIIQCLFLIFAIHHTSLFDAFKLLVATICLQGWKYCIQWTKILTIKLILSTFCLITLTCISRWSRYQVTESFIWFLFIFTHTHVFWWIYWSKTVLFF